MSLPRMRTAPAALDEIKKADPESCLTLRALRRMMNTGEIPCVSVNSKRLINLDILFEYLNGQTQEQASSEEYGKIRKVV